MSNFWQRPIKTQEDSLKRRRRLTERELEILCQISCGKTNKQISQFLSLSTSTVKNHISGIFTKLDFSNRSQAVAYAIQSGILNEYLSKATGEQKENQVS